MNLAEVSLAPFLPLRRYKFPRCPSSLGGPFPTRRDSMCPFCFYVWRLTEWYRRRLLKLTNLCICFRSAWRLFLSPCFLTGMITLSFWLLFFPFCFFRYILFKVSPLFSLVRSLCFHSQVAVHSVSKIIHSSSDSLVILGNEIVWPKAFFPWKIFLLQMPHGSFNITFRFRIG